MASRLPIIVKHVFQSYPVFYQPYIPPAMEALWQSTKLDFEIQVFKEGSGTYVKTLPGYYYRRAYETLYQFFKKDAHPLNYLEIQALKAGVDIIHLQDSYLFNKVLGLLQLPKDNRPKIVITLRGNDTYIKPWVQEKWQNFYATFGHDVDAFVVMSAHQKTYLTTHWGVPPNKVHVIPISFGGTQLVTPKTLQGATLQVVSAFRMCWEKNIAGNLRTIQVLKSLGVPVHYTIYGDGPDSGQVYYLITKYGLQDVVSYKGRVSNTVLKSALPTYDFFLQLSHSEALPTSVLEAQSYGLPAIVSDSGGLPEAILPNESGHVVAAHDAEAAAACIIDLWRHPETYVRFSEQAILHSQAQFSVAHEVDRLLTLYETLVD